MSALVNDALALLDAVTPESLEPRAQQTYALLALVAGLTRRDGAWILA